MGRRDIPVNLKELQKAKRIATINKIQEAIDDIKHDGGVVTKKRLIDLTNLSSATFSKSHVLEVLKANEVCQFKNTIKKEGNIKEEHIEQLAKKIKKLEREKNLLMSKLQDKDIAINKYKVDYHNLNENYMLILGKLHSLMKKIEILDIDIGLDLENF